MVRLLSKILLVLALVIVFALVAAVLLAIDDEMTVNRVAEITPADIERAKHILKRHDPRMMKSGMRNTIVVNQQDLDLAANYLANRYARGSARVVLMEDALLVNASIALPRNPVGHFMNIDVTLAESDSLLSLKRLRVGLLPLPVWLANRLIDWGFEALGRDEDYGFAAKIIKGVDIADGTMRVSYEWQEGLVSKMRHVLVSHEEQERIRAYQSRLTQVVHSLSSNAVSLTDLVVPLFTLGQERSGGGDPIAENRSAILVLAVYVNGRGLHHIVPAAKDWPRPPSRTVTLNGRDDLAKHFIVSAMIAANTGVPLSDAVGLYKELSDIRKGSGFSFSDICADRAGTRFGEIASGNSGSARQLQRQLSGGVHQIIPLTKHLPEFLSEVEFKKEFGGVGAPPYEAMMTEIEHRIAVLPLYR